MKTAQFTHEEKVLVFVLGTLHNLIDAQVICGPKALTGKGLKLFRLLSEEGFEPSPEEIEGTMEYLTSQEWRDAMQGDLLDG